MLKRRLVVTLERRGGDLRARTAPYPNMNPTLREFVHDNANELVQREREVAKLIWGVIEGLGGDRPRNWDDE